MSGETSGSFPGQAFGLGGKVVAVTGAGSGIGRSMALAFAGHGAFLALLDVNAPALAQTAQAIRAGNGKCLEAVCDVADPEAVASTARRTAEALGHCDILLNNAGMIRPGPLATVDLEDWNRVLAVNLTGYLLCAREFGAQMRERRRGSIVHVASIASDLATPYAGAYSVAKAGVAMLSRQLAVEWATDGIRSNCVCPGMILTELSRPMVDRPGIRERRAAMIPLGRIGEPDDIVGAALYLASDLSAYVTGAELTVDGGFTRNLLNLVPRSGYEHGNAAGGSAGDATCISRTGRRRNSTP